MKPLGILIILSFVMASCHNQTNTSEQKHNDSINPNKSPIVTDSVSTGLTNDDFMRFWLKFRTAVLNFDTTQIIELTEFPFLTRGPDDSDPTIGYNKKKFVRVFKAFLNQATTYELDDSAKNLTNITELDDIRKTETPNKKDILPDQARIGDLWFSKTGKKWKLALAYLEYSTIDSIKK